MLCPAELRGRSGTTVGRLAISGNQWVQRPGRRGRFWDAAVESDGLSVTLTPDLCCPISPTAKHIVHFGCMDGTNLDGDALDDGPDTLGNNLVCLWTADHTARYKGGKMRAAVFWGIWYLCKIFHQCQVVIYNFLMCCGNNVVMGYLCFFEIENTPAETRPTARLPVTPIREGR